VNVTGEGNGRARRVSATMNNLDTAIAQIRPNSNELAVFEAMFVAVEQAASTGAKHPLVLVLGSSLDSTTTVGFVNGSLGAEPNEIADAVKTANPTVDLSGVAVLFADGVGYGAGTQGYLNDAQRQILASALVSVTSAFGASGAVDPGQASGDPVSTTFTVTPVSFDTPDPTVWTNTNGSPCQPVVQVYDATSALRFQPNSDQWADTAAAQVTLAPIAAWLAADPTRRIAIEGRTMNFGSLESQQQTGRDRANATRDALVAAGANVDQITTSGVGSQFAGYYKPDFLPSGDAVPEAAAKNRNIQITAQDNC